MLRPVMQSPPSHQLPGNPVVRALVSGCVVLLAFGGCTRETPLEAFDRFALALEQGDRALALQLLTPDSARAMGGLLDVDTDGSTFPKSGFSTTTRAFSQVGTDGPDGALITVRTSDKPPELALVAMRQIDGDWRLDIIRTEMLWNRDWAMSGSTRPAPSAWADGPILELE